MAVPTLAQVVSALDRRFPPQLAEAWDRVGLVCGDPDAPVERVLFAVDPTQAIADEAVHCGAQLLVTHHPLLLRGVHSVAATTGKGRVVHRLVSGGCGLFTMHTNADAASGGTNATLASLLGIEDAQPLIRSPGTAMDKLVAFVPPGHRAGLLEALFAAGAGNIGEYDSCAYWTEGTGQFRPSPAADPFIGERGQLTQVAESRIELVFPRSRRDAVVAAMRAAHPYEQPAFDVWETAPAGHLGIGRLGRLVEAVPLRVFAQRVANVLPPTAAGVRVAGDPERLVRDVAICTGAGDSLLAAVRRTAADVYITADLRHHPAEEHLAERGCALIDVSHWASEWPWLDGAARDIAADLGTDGFTVEAQVSRTSTDPWSFLVGGPN